MVLAHLQMCWKGEEIEAKPGSGCCPGGHRHPLSGAPPPLWRWPAEEAKNSKLSLAPPLVVWWHCHHYGDAHLDLAEKGSVGTITGVSSVHCHDKGVACYDWGGAYKLVWMDKFIRWHLVSGLNGYMSCESIQTSLFQVWFNLKKNSSSNWNLSYIIKSE